MRDREIENSRRFRSCGCHNQEGGTDSIALVGSFGLKDFMLRCTRKVEL